MRADQLLASFAAAFSQDQRLISLQIGDGAAWGDQLLPQRVTGTEGINQPFLYYIDCLSTDAALELKSLLGLPVVLSITDAEGGVVERCGVVSQAQLLGSDGGFAQYKLTVEPPFALLRYRLTSRVLQDLSVPDIIKKILAEHQDKNPVFASVQTLDFKLSGDYPSQSYTTQKNESDYAFLCRIMQREGLSWRFVHLAGDSPQVQMVIFDDAYAIPEASDSHVRFHRADSTEEADALTDWTTQRQLGSCSVALASFDYKAVKTNQSFDDSSIDQGEGGQQIQSSFEDYGSLAHYYANNSEDLSHYAQLRQQSHDQAKKSFSGSGTLRSLQAGQWFRLEDHPAHEWDAAEKREFVVTELKFTANNNLPLDLTQQLLMLAPSLLAGSNPAVAAENAPYQADFTAQRRGQALTPRYDESSKPSSFGVQTATVVGPAGSEVHTDELGRIKIQFSWQRADEHPEFGANLDDKSSCWVRVAYPSAGASWGHQFIPRIGQEVLVSYLDNDIDRPIVTGVVYNGSHGVPDFSGAGSLPANKTLSGIKTKEHQGGQYNELLFDDTPQEVRAKLSSETGKTQLNQGFLTHPRKDGKAEPRGNGFELRTDLAGAIRGAQGLLLTAHDQPSARGAQLERDELIAQLEQALAIAQQLAKQAETHEAESTDTKQEEQLLNDLKKWHAGSNTDKEGKGGGKGIVAMSAPAGIAISSQSAISMVSGANHDQIAAKDSNHSIGQKLRFRIGESLSIFVQQMGMKLIAAAGKIHIQAQSDQMEIGSAKRLHLYSLEEIFLEAPKITLRTQGTDIALGAGNIITQASGTHTQKASQHNMEGPGNGSPQLPKMPKSESKTDEQFSIVSRSGKAITEVKHEIHSDAGKLLESGSTDAKGASSRLVGKAIESINLKLTRKK
ncbi:type VI secretion system Vgr family protein [Janthinobacterium sp. B9-8]|uniref:type VI secretion system Vgr family protein n=1 Tax=Janthinobacterium sp. B9-8 TaxID=1236179 RepID=UPI00061CF066|nr:type VI secretion system Vgr family protein [Janthinobacterium sp. B9-8]AMC36612.1 type VI secretion system protein [Janthinobacterium sp. B9-8]